MEQVELLAIADLMQRTILTLITLQVITSEAPAKHFDNGMQAFRIK